MALHIPCRFTDRYLEVRPHGHGVKLTLSFPSAAWIDQRLPDPRRYARPDPRAGGH
jgi:hypothetical protein